MKSKSILLTRPFLLLSVMSFLLSSTLKAQTYCNYTSQVAYDFGLNTQAQDRPYGMLEQPDGKLVVYGTSYFNSSNSFRVSIMRLNADLTLDTLFGTGGKVVKTWSQRNFGVVGFLQSDGKILVGGSQAPSNASSQIKPSIGRFNSDGSVDASFGALGVVKIDTLGRGAVIGVKELPNGKIRIVLVRSSPAGFILMQLNADGSGDTSFANYGSVFHPFSNSLWGQEMDGVLFTADTSAIVTWTSFNPQTGAKKPMIIKFTSDGGIDSTFAQNGVLDIDQTISTPSSNYRGVRSKLTANEDIIIGATTGVNAARKMFLYKIDGQTGIIDSTGFGTNGKILSAQSLVFNEVKNLEIDPSNGDIYAVGTSSATGNKAATWRVSSSGVEINQCGGNPIKLFLMGYQYTSNFYAAKFVCNGKLRLVGYSGMLDTLTSYANQSLNYMIPYDTMPNPITFVNDTACDSYISPSGNFVWDSTGTYMDTMTNVLGCDSLLSIDLVIKNSTSATISPVVCNSYTAPSGLNSWTTSGMYIDTIPNAVGCDSVITINLTVNYSSFFTFNATACDSYSSPSGNYVWTNSGTYMDTIPNALGCDSVITVILTMNNSSSSTQVLTVCNSYTSPSGANTWTSSGTYMDTIPNLAGCDSVITVNLTINNPDTAVTVNGFILTASAAGAQYQWLDCSKNMEAVNGATNQTFVPTANGNYAVEVTQNGCADTSACFAVVGVGIDEQNIFSEISFYPNPSTGILNFKFENLKQVEIKIYDLNGRLIRHESAIQEQSYQLILNTAPGMYVLELSSEGASKTYKLIVR